MLNSIDTSVALDCNLVRKCLAKVLASPIFASAPKQQKLLEYLVLESHCGNGKKLKGYTIATEVFDAHTEFDSNLNSSVRVSANRLRSNLCEYYRDFGEADDVRFHLAIGRYEIIFLRKLTGLHGPQKEEISALPERRHGYDRRKASIGSNFNSH